MLEALLMVASLSAAPALPEDPTPWEYSTETSEMTDSVYHITKTRSVRSYLDSAGKKRTPMLRIHCREPDPSGQGNYYQITVGFGTYVGLREKQFSVRMDSEEARREKFFLDSVGKSGRLGAAFTWYYIDTILAGHDRMLVAFSPFREGRTVMAEFDLRGMEAALAPLKEGCGGWGRKGYGFKAYKKRLQQ